jgi:hypothetical protein
LAIGIQKLCAGRIRTVRLFVDNEIATANPNGRTARGRRDYGIETGCVVEVVRSSPERKVHIVAGIEHKSLVCESSILVVKRLAKNFHAIDNHVTGRAIASTPIGVLPERSCGIRARHRRGPAHNRKGAGAARVQMHFAGVNRSRSRGTITDVYCDIRISDRSFEAFKIFVGKESIRMLT